MDLKLSKVCIFLGTGRGLISPSLEGKCFFLDAFFELGLLNMKLLASIFLFGLLKIPSNDARENSLVYKEYFCSLKDMMCETIETKSLLIH